MVSDWKEWTHGSLDVSMGVVTYFKVLRYQSCYKEAAKVGMQVQNSNEYLSAVCFVWLKTTSICVYKFFCMCANSNVCVCDACEARVKPYVLLRNAIQLL